MDKSEVDQILSQCTRYLTGHYRLTPRQTLLDLAESTPADLNVDFYGQGNLISDFEEQVAILLGKESAVFMPSGTMCQQIALRIWCERKRISSVAFHPKCHLEIHEQKGYQRLHGLHGLLVGSPDRLIKLDDLQQVKEPLAALLIELPQR
jgi:threonine aldolase